ncbi:MAG: hypothetical protein ACD_33C00002G0037 [uncultured bacterium]|nr:MAG: hypothetical protein ACD_33C00002G0037 [uncultured bacterium]
MKEEKTEIKPEFLGMASINSFIPNTSSPRGVMLGSHFSSHLPILSPDSKLIKSGTEFELGKYINHVTTNKDCIVKAVIPRYGNYGLDKVPEYLVIIEYEENNNLFLDYIEVKTFESTHTFFGYKLHLTDEFKDIMINQKLNRDTILSKADSYSKDGSYAYGINANIVMMTHPSVSEDGYVVSESFLNKTKFDTIAKRVININKNTLPINMYGNDEVFNFIPNIGYKVRADGLLCAMRERNDWFNITDISNTSLREVDMNFDILTYVSPDSIVVDVKVLKGNYNKSEFTNKMASQLDTYADMLITYNKNIISQVNQILTEKKSMYGNTEYVRMSPKLHRLLTDTQIIIDSSANNKIKLCYRKLPIDQYRIEITTMATIKPNLGFKITDIHA